ncbi:hypothetical protein LOK49_LG08G01412 [Camellia lanceoleosa]|uniref:Uncharacterized protein n=1 Tax=Camellia lanceoleosa TaxID=1840588 RepID=A0ACC0GNZ7_9ERIC|nr:hypothetical protein LOK49_LG08G01412 [Camellia lanceoleosa]
MGLDNTTDSIGLLVLSTERGDKVNDLNLLPATKSIDVSSELVAGVTTCQGLPVSVVEMTQDSSWNADLSSQPVIFSSAQNQDLDQSSHDVSKSKVELDEHSQASSEVTELDPCENEVQSPMTAIHLRGTSKSKAKKSSMKVRRGDISDA